MQGFNLEIVTPQKLIARGKVTELTVPGELGEMTLLPEHTHIISYLGKGRLLYRTVEGQRFQLEIESGFIHFESGNAIVLTEKALESTTA
ncbi:MAG: F0F1 ATP synthase subunit epsilon [Deltaproteobacteria bacterium]|nr:F0F1 ATP synthase subunit epsilon [Deltaproteobacteria bacterium]